MKKEVDAYEVVLKKLEEYIKPKPYRKSKQTEEEHKLSEYKRILSLSTPLFLIETNPQFRNKYIPLQRTEMLLRAIFGSYQITMPHPPLYAEGIITFVVSIVVKHPITKEAMNYDGVSAVPMKPAFGKITDVHYHVPAAKSFAIMNAASHIGRIFRAQADDYTDVFKTFFEVMPETVSNEDLAKKNMKERLIKMIDKSETLDSLNKKWDEVSKLDDNEVLVIFSDKRNKLLNQSNPTLLNNVVVNSFQPKISIKK